MQKEEIESLLDKAYGLGKQLLQYWHERKMEHIRLQSANMRHIEELKSALVEGREHSRYEQRDRPREKRPFNRGMGGD